MALPVNDKPVTLTDLPLPMAGVSKVPTGVPVRLTLAVSAGSTPSRVAVPIKVAAVVPSKTRLLADKPVIVRFLTVISAVKVGAVKV